MWRRLTPTQAFLLAAAVALPWVQAVFSRGSYYFALGITGFALAALVVRR